MGLQGQIAAGRPNPAAAVVQEEARAHYLLAPLGFLGTCFLPSCLPPAPSTLPCSSWHPPGPPR